MVSCLAPCKKWNYPSPYGLGQDETMNDGRFFCCPTPPISPETCRAGIVTTTNYVRLIGQVCPTAYAYAYDDASGLHSCPSTASFIVNFC